MGRRIAVQLVGYVGTTKVANVTVSYFHSVLDAHNCIEHLQVNSSEEMEELKVALCRFLGFRDVFFVYRKKEEN